MLYIYLPGNDLGIAVIVLTLLIKLVLHPFSLKGLRSQQAMTRLQPQIKELQNKYKEDKAAQSKALMELYKREKISPFSGCLPLLLQLPIIIALYQVFLKGLTPESLNSALYSFVPNPGAIPFTFFGLNLEQGSFVIVVALIAGVAQFFQAKLIAAKQPKKKTGQKDFSSMMQSQMLYFFPLLTIFIIWKFGAVIGLYWLFSTLFSIGEQYLIKAKEHGEKRPEEN